MGNASTRPPEDVRHPQLGASALTRPSLDSSSSGLHAAAVGGDTEQLSEGDAADQSSFDASRDTETKLESPVQSVATEIQPSSPIKTSLMAKSPEGSPSAPPAVPVLIRKRSKRLETQSCQVLLQENQQLREGIASEISLQASIKDMLIKKELKIAQFENQLAKLKSEISH